MINIIKFLYSVSNDTQAENPGRNVVVIHQILDVNLKELFYKLDLDPTMPGHKI